MLHVAPQGEIDQCLIAASASGVYLGAKPVEDIVIDPDRYPGLSWRERDDGPALPLAEIVLSFHESLLVPVKPHGSRICTNVQPVNAPVATDIEGPTPTATAAVSLLPAFP